MFNGISQNKLDQKNRVKIPTKILKQIQSVSTSKKIFITKGFEKCLYLYTEERWREIFEKYQNTAMNSREQRFFDRFFFGLAESVDIDASGRLLIPDSLRGRLGDSKEVVFAGVRNRIEAWAPDRWQAFIEENEDDFENLASALTL